MDLKDRIDDAIAGRSTRPKGIRVSIDAFIELEASGNIVRGNGGPHGIPWASDVPFYDSDIYVWCDPTLEEEYELPAR